jgi:signal transduction histidine kinase
MKLSKIKKKELMQVYEAYWAEYLNGNVEAMQALLDDSYTQIGSAESEVFSSKKEAVQFLVDTIDQVAGKLEMRNRSTKLEQQDHLILIHEVCDLYALADKKWVFYSKFRASTLLQEKKEGWKITHQHSSFPDTKTEAGQNVAIEKIAEENKELREAVKRRTVELEQKNRELQIEAALERVRARAMAMQKSEELADLSFELVKQVQALGVPTWFCAFNIYDNDPKGSIEWGSNGEGIFPNYRTPREGIFLHYYKAGQRGESLLINEIGEKDCPGHYEYLCSLPGVGEQLLKMKEAGIPFPTSQIDHVAFFKYGYILFITFEPAPESYEVFKRFSKVFEQTYTRFLDLQKAEAQTREARIEAALERVRARAMAMHKSEELAEAAELLYLQLKDLGIDPWTCGYVFVEEEKNEVKVWMVNPGGKFFWGFWTVPMSEEKVLKERHESWKKKENIHRKLLKGQENIDHHRYIVKHSPITPDEAKGFLSTIPVDLLFTSLHFSHGYLMVISESFLSEEEENVLLRFTQVFELTYTRFLDLQKAETQAKEAEIQLALERVRAKALAMHSSNELIDVSIVLREQMAAIGQDQLETIAIHFIPKDSSQFSAWFAFHPPDKDESQIKFGSVDFSKTETFYARKFIQLYNSDQSDYLIEASGKHLDEWQDMLMARVPVFQELWKNDVPGHQYWYFSDFSGGNLMLITLKEAASEALELLRRSAQVFDLAYRRFLDLQKAEAQTREAQIEAAMERIRSRAIAMRTSNELLEVALEIRIQTDLLGQQDLELSVVHLYEKDAEYFESLAAMRTPGSEGEITTHKMKFPVDATPEIQQMMKNYWAGLSQYTIELNLKQREAWQKVLETTVPDLFDQRLQFDEDEIVAEKKEYWNFTDFSGGSLLTVTYSPPTTETKELFRRAADVFDLAYKRFKDLKNAEKQAREAQIEAALERVRSRSMAMHKSEELKDVIQVVYDQFVNLSIHTEHTGFIIDYNENDDMHIWLADKNEVATEVIIPYFDCAHWNSFNEAKKNGKNFFANHLTFKEKNKFYKNLFKQTPDLPKSLLEIYLNYPGLAISTVLLENVALYIENFDGIPYSDEENDTLMRFGKVFQQTYTRFLDLQKAEAQSREAQIETALERVRSRTMAMQKSEELLDAAEILSAELVNLEIPHFMSGFVLVDETAEKQGVHMGIPGQGRQAKFYLPLKGDAVLKKRYKSWKNAEPIFYQRVKGEKLAAHMAYVTQHFESDEMVETGRKIPDPVIFYCGNFKEGYLHILSEVYLNEEQESILARFTKIFQQTYTRFLDLKKAEAQAREAQIEAALEKVRSRSLAMQRSEELQDVVQVVAEKLIELDVVLDVGGVVICTYYPDSMDVMHWTASFDDTHPSVPYYLPYFDTPIFIETWASKNSGTDFFEKVFSYKDKNHFFLHAFEHSDYMNLPEEYKKEILLVSNHALSFAWQTNSALMIPSHTGKLLPEEHKTILKRFSKVFEQAYIRFMDLQKAEAQARESQIEMALERVRTASMTMQKGDELAHVISVVFTQLKILGVDSEGCGLNLYDEHDGMVMWMSGFGEDLHPKSFHIAYFDHPYYQAQLEAWKEQRDYMVLAFEGDLKKSMDDQTFANKDFFDLPKDIKETFLSKEKTISSSAFMKYGMLEMIGDEALSADQATILCRFAKVFEQAYQRFLDIEKAEAQAREAQIEGALERVRSKTMAMHNSEDLEDIVVSLFDEVLNLGLDKSIRCGIGILEGHEGMETRSINSKPDGTVELRVGMLDMTIHPMLIDLKKAWENGSKRYSYYYNTKDVRTYYEALNNEPEYPFNANLETLPEQEYHQSFIYSSGIIFAFSKNPISEESSKILARFAAVFGQTYRRFLDLKKAELQAKDAIKQASLDRVRGQIASMRTAADLERITPLVWNELTTMSVPFIRCGVFIIDEPTEIVQVYLSAPDGHSLGVLHLQFNADPLTANTVAHWQKGRIFKDHWNREEFISWTQSLMEQGQISDKNTYQGAANPPESLNLHFIPFTQGMLYVGSENPLNVEQIELVQSLADAFAIAYARYEDFTKLEKAKESVETTLTELKATQNQLVQSEKMASLGELTAGIAHEIQNPLNFVNNFSEVSKELLEEMMEEMQKGDVEEVKALADDIIQNLKKIHHHGKRADGIVKGMLQHSRTSSGEKEPTDINALADEYLRLAYHGLRAKDKSFNAATKTDFEENIGDINIIPQDIGRVMLNLITNAFYVVDEKKKQLQEGYHPKISVSTKKINGKVEIKVTDNGNGIPKKVLAKIFQPFFTTKPTGQGTGLGLSLSYDIIKAHKGEISVKSKVGEGTTFTIALPS